MDVKTSELDKIKSLGQIISLDDVATKLNLDFVPKKKVLIMGGSKEIPGAPLLTARAAKKCGAKAIVYASTADAMEKINILYAGALKLSEMKNFGKKEIKQKIMPTIHRYGCIVLGPGMYPNNRDVEGIKYLLSNYKFKTPIIIDANAIDIVAKDLDLLKKIDAEKILTPNLNEFSKLIGKDLLNIEDIVREGKIFCTKYNVNLLIKSKIDTIINRDIAKFNIAGQPVLAVAGSGDCVAGCVAGFVALGNTPFDSCCAGIYIFSRAGSFHYEKVGYSLDPEGVINEIPVVMKEILDLNTIAQFRYYR